jgi:hypothetical protein
VDSIQAWMQYLIRGGWVLGERELGNEELGLWVGGSRKGLGWDRGWEGLEGEGLGFLWGL